MTTYVTPKKGAEYIFYVGLIDQSNTKLLKSNPTLASGDFKVSIDGGALANLSTLPTVTPASGRQVKITLSTSEMNGDNITVQCVDASGAEWCDLLVNIQTSANQIDDLATQLTTIDDFIDTEVAAIKAKTDNLPTDPADASDVAAAFSTVNSTLATLGGYIDTEVAAIKAKTDNLPADPADASDIAAAFATVNTKLDTIDDFIDTEVSAIKAKTDSLTFTVAGKVDANTTAINGNATAAANQAKANESNGRGTVGAASSTTSIVTSAFAPAGSVADQFKGRIITFDADTTTAALRGQSTDITANTSAATPVITVTALTTAPASGDTFSVT